MHDVKKSLKISYNAISLAYTQRSVSYMAHLQEYPS